MNSATNAPTFHGLLSAIGYAPCPYSGSDVNGGEPCWSVTASLGDFAGAVVLYELDRRISPDLRGRVADALCSARADGAVLYFPHERVSVSDDFRMM